MEDMGETSGAMNQPQDDTSNLQKQPEKSKEPISEKIITVLISSLLSLIGGYYLHYLTTDKPHIFMTVSPPFAQYNTGSSVDKFMHIITIKNDSNKLAEDIELTIKGVKDKIHERKITGNPPLVSCNAAFSNDGILSLKCGDLKPRGIISISLLYDNPPIKNSDIEVYAKEATYGR
jgi:hypothetical protein